jgi:phosphatidylserine/phosphatidylglycerophosphate/cardiolipin synthase-like enzyme
MHCGKRWTLTISEIDLGAIRSPEGFFLARNTAPQAFLASSDSDGLYRHRFTYRESAESIRDAAVDLIRGAEHKIFVASFRIGDRRILDALLDAVGRLHGGVYVITAWNERSLRHDLAGIEEDLEEIDVAAQKKQFGDLTRRGIALRGHEQCHAKFLVVDDRRALVSSANLETSALADQPGRRAATSESGVVLVDPGEAERLARLFTQLWFTGCTWEAPTGAEYALRRRDPTPSPTSATPSSASHGLIWTDGEERGILSTLHDVIASARSELLLATFRLKGVRERPDMLLDPLRQAISDHGVDVRLLVRARNNLAGHRADAAALAEVGVRLHADSGTHAKAVLADGRYGALFSANLDAEHGLYSGVEVGVRLDGRPVLAEARRFLLHAMAHADRRFEPHPTMTELDTGLRAAWQHRWPSDHPLVLEAPDPIWRSLQDASATGGPTLWENTGDLRLYFGTRVYRLRQAGAIHHLTAEPDAEPTIQRLRRWYERPSANQARGICPAQLRRNGA